MEEQMTHRYFTPSPGSSRVIRSYRKPRPRPASCREELCPRLEEFSCLNATSGLGLLMTKSDDRVAEWEVGLPSPDELTPLSQSLIPPELASAFSITPEPFRTVTDLHRASQSTFTSLHATSSASIPPFKNPNAFFHLQEERGACPVFDFGTDEQAGESGGGASGGGDVGKVAGGAVMQGSDQDFSQYRQSFHGQTIPTAGFSPMLGRLGSSPGALNSFLPYAASSYGRKTEILPSSATGLLGTDSSDSVARKSDKLNEGEPEETDSGTAPEISNEEQAARTLKRPRLVWTPQLHKRFVDAVTHLGIKNAVPKTIMQLMNVEGLTRENVASHLQKYRLYLKRMQGFSNEGPSASDQLFASTPLPPSLAASAHFLPGHRDDGIPMPFAAPVVPFPLAGFGDGLRPGQLNPSGPFAGFDPHAYSALIRTPPQRFLSVDQRELVGGHQSQAASPSRPVLTLFPTSSR